MKNNFFQKDYITVDCLSPSDVNTIFKKSLEMKRLVEKKGGDTRLKGKVLGAIFYEPSSRTFSSFVTAMQRLGGGFIPIHGVQNTSVVKGETLEDTVRVFSSYADALGIRHPEPGSIEIAAKYATVPVINAGDGIGEHPTQALIDIYTMQEALGDVNKLHILMIGDLAHYRPTNSMAKLLAIFPKVKLSFASPREVPLPDNIRNFLKQKKINFREYNDFEKLLPDADVLYVTRVKKEYMSEKLYKKIQGSYIINNKTLQKMKRKSIVMHCLPRVGEISTDIDTDPRSLYLTHEVRNGLYVRMALLDLILNKYER